MLAEKDGITRRRMIGYLIAAPTLVAAAPWRLAPAPATAAVPSVQRTDHYDFSDMMRDAAEPTMDLLTVTVNADGTATFDLPRVEVGQGITTAIAMTIADELELPVDKVEIRLADSRPELVWNQYTAASTTMHILYEPVRTAAASAREQLATAAANELGVPASDLTLLDGVITAPDGRSLTYGSLAEKAAVRETTPVRPRLKAQSKQKIVGRGQSRIDGREIVTGRKQFAMDLDVPGAVPTMLCRPPTINGTARAIQNLAEVRAMPGVTDVVLVPREQFVPGGVAVCAKTFGQCIDAIRALKVTWGPGTADGKSDASVLADLRAAEQPLPPAPPGESLEQLFTFHFRPGDPLETNTAVADVRPDRAEVWACLQGPIFTHQQVAKLVGLPEDRVTVHVVPGGGAFGRRLFSDAAFEAAVISKRIGKPVKLMWHRTDNFRQGRVHPMAISRVRVTRSGDDVVALNQRHTSVATDFTCGLGEMMTVTLATPPGFNLGYARAYFDATANVPYEFGAVSQALDEIYEYDTFNTGSVRSVYSSSARTAVELMVDKLAATLGKDPLRFRRDFAKDDRMRAVIDRVAAAGRWGRRMKPGTAQGIAVHSEHKGRSACLVELDCRPKTVDRKVRHAYTGPRVTRVVYAVDVGLPINPLGIEAQIMGGAMDGIAQALSYGLHLENGHFLEGSWDDAFYTRQWNTPREVKVIVMPPTTGDPGGAGEFAVSTTMAAVACAYARATGKMPTEFPLNHAEPLGFKPFPTVPPIPQSPRDGRRRAH